MLPALGLEQMRTADEQVAKGVEGYQEVTVQEVGGEVMVIHLEEGAKGWVEVEAAEAGVVNVAEEVAETVPVMMAATGGVWTSAELGKE